ncbi:hypothetical protein M514_05389 [Trichuris suis]|uniref:Uncharacterized protein n=1 Tax=Trichuris suis TaxID=68888 RepID=A0A085NSF1_9BILA|nr:hypothetical protein M513_05389 [Trichuris suis]KFD72397.1 hypothetical protein M514_05389 [Trichuris suis]
MEYDESPIGIRSPGCMPLFTAFSIVSVSVLVMRSNSGKKDASVGGADCVDLFDFSGLPRTMLLQSSGKLLASSASYKKCRSHLLRSLADVPEQSYRSADIRSELQETLFTDELGFSEKSSRLKPPTLKSSSLYFVPKYQPKGVSLSEIFIIPPNAACCEKINENKLFALDELVAGKTCRSSDTQVLSSCPWLADIAARLKLSTNLMVRASLRKAQKEVGE